MGRLAGSKIRLCGGPRHVTAVSNGHYTPPRHCRPKSPNSKVFRRTHSGGTTMAINTGMIDGIQVPGNRYIVYGKQRGYVATHRTKRAAYRSLVADSRVAMADGKPSDAQVYRWIGG